MVGTRLAGTNIVIDTFRHAGAGATGSTSASAAAPRSVQHVYFLTHAHADHTVGLSPTWDLGPIYCSNATRDIVLHKFDGLDPTLVIGLSLNEPHSIPLATLPKHSSHTTEAAIPHVTVTLIDANHCPGAAMLLLEGYFGVVLHTGDFRFDAERMGSHPALKGVSLDALYLDNTYGHPKFDLPTRLEAAAAVVHVIRQHPQHQIILGVDSLGKEELLHYLATYFGMPVLVTPTRLALIHKLGYPEYRDPRVFTSDPRVLRNGTTRLRVWPRHMVSAAAVTRENNDDVLAPPCIAIVPSGWCPGGAVPGQGDHVDDATAPHPLVSTTDGVVFRVAYSLHSSYAELRDALRTWRPRSVIPTSVTTTEAMVEMQHLCAPFLDPSPPSVPPSQVVLPASLRCAIHGQRWRALQVQQQQQQQRQQCERSNRGASKLQAKRAALKRAVKAHHRQLRRSRTAQIRRRQDLLQRRGPRQSSTHDDAARHHNADAPEVGEGGGESPPGVAPSPQPRAGRDEPSSRPRGQPERDAAGCDHHSVRPGGTHRSPAAAHFGSAQGRSTKGTAKRGSLDDGTSHVGASERRVRRRRGPVNTASDDSPPPQAKQAVPGGVLLLASSSGRCCVTAQGEHCKTASRSRGNRSPKHARRGTPRRVDRPSTKRRGWPRGRSVRADTPPCGSSRDRIVSNLESLLV